MRIKYHIVKSKRPRLPNAEHLYYSDTGRSVCCTKILFIFSYMVSPYSNYLSDYYSTSKEKFVVTLLNRDLLKPNLEAVGNVRPNNSAAHHIVVGGSSKADDARKLLKEADIDINEASNGVFLPKSSKYVIDEASPHANVHTDAYYRNIYDRLEKTPINQRRYELQKIAEELQNGIFPY